MQPEWLAKPFSIMGHTFDWFLLPEDPPGQARYKRALGFDAEHWLGSLFKTGGDDGKSWLFRTRHGFIEDRLGPYLAPAREQGLKVLVYVNVHWFKADVGEEMLARKADGSPVAAYGAGCLTCPAGPFLAYSVALAEDLGEYPVDGVFLDGPIGATCWCEHCRRAYRQRFGEELASGPADLPQRRRMEQYNAEKVARFVEAFRQALRAKQPHAVVYHNGSSLGQLTWANRRTVQRADLLGAEGGFLGYRPMTGQFLYKTSATGKLLAALAGGKPTVIFNDHAFKSFDYWPLPRPELDLLFAATLATGANPWFLLYYHNRDTHAAAAARYWNAFIAEHREELAGTLPAERLAVLWSDTTALAARPGRAVGDSVHHEAAGEARISDLAGVDHRAAFNGAYALLARSGLGFRIVTETDLEPALGEIDVLVAPSVVALEESAFAAVERFVQAGGLLLADERFALLDEEGRPRDPARLAGLLGTAPAEPIASAAANIDYIAASRGRLFKGITPAPLPRPQRAFRVQTAGGKPLAFFHEPFAGRYDHLTPVSRMPALIENAFGRGHAIYMPMDFFEHYEAFNFDDHRLLAINAVARRWVPPVSVAGLGGRGEVMLRRKGGKMLVHLLNYGGAVRPFARITSLRGVRITLRGGKIASARALHLGRGLPVRAGRAGWTARLPRLDAAETVVLKLNA